MDGYYGDGLGWAGWLLVTLAVVAFWALVVFGLVALFRGTRDAGAVRRTPKQILDERFARGEIDAVEYEARRDALRDLVTPESTLPAAPHATSPDARDREQGERTEKSPVLHIRPRGSR